MKPVDYAIAIFFGTILFIVGTAFAAHVHFQRPFVWGLLAGIVTYLWAWYLMQPIGTEPGIPRVPETTLPDDWEGA